MKIQVSNQKTNQNISKYIYGHFSEHLGRCIYDGLYVGEASSIPNHKGMRSDVVAALKHIKVPVLRWPGGCFADEYHWKDGIGDKSQRPSMVNTHWGGVTEDNSFGTHEFYELCQQIGCEPYVNGNVGSGTVQEMSEWVEYITMDGASPMSNLRRENGQDAAWKLPFFGVGNESWGCGGNMRPEYYADLYRRYQTYVRQYSKDKIYKIACGASVDDYHWTEVIMQNVPLDLMDGLSLHHYAFVQGWEPKGSATNFQEKEWWSLLESAQYMDELITKHATIMDQYDPEKKVGLIVDEWGSWLAVEPGTNPGFLYQQNTIRDAQVAALTLNIFHKHADRVHMANIAQTVNVLQAVLLTEGDKLVKTPTYHVFDLYKVHQDAEVVSCYSNEALEHVSYTVSKKDGVTAISVANYDLTEEKVLDFSFDEEMVVQASDYIYGDQMDAHNTFDHPEQISVQPFTGVTVQGGKVSITAPKMSVITVQVKANDL